MGRSIWHLTWENAENASVGLGVACSELVIAMGGGNRLIAAPCLLEGGANSFEAYSSYDSQEGCGSLDWERVLHLLESGQSCQFDSTLDQVWRFNQAVLGLDRSDLAAVHVHDWHGLIAGVALKWIMGVPLVYHVHSSQIEREGEHVRDLVYSLEQWGLDNADAVICVSHRSKRILHRHYDVQAHAVEVVWNSSHFPFVRAAQPQGRITFVGRLTEQKNPQLMIEILREWRKLNPSAQLLFVGSGNMLDDLRALTDFYGLRDTVCFIPHVTHADLTSILRRVDALCVPSIDEPFGIVALEAARAGKCVFLSENTGVEEVLKSAEVLPKAEPARWAQAIDALLRDEDLYFDRVARLQKEAASYTWQDAAEKVLAIYARLLD
jgi:glycosyltransferase involved in cell wall biosynthesis